MRFYGDSADVLAVPGDNRYAGVQDVREGEVTEPDQVQSPAPPQLLQSLHDTEVEQNLCQENGTRRVIAGQQFCGSCSGGFLATKSFQERNAVGGIPLRGPAPRQTRAAAPGPSGYQCGPSGMRAWFGLGKCGAVASGE
jgi:hypothetical protein